MLNKELEFTLNQAFASAHDKRHEFMTIEHLLLALADGLGLFELGARGYGWRALDIGVYRVSYDWMGLSRECRETKDHFWAAFLEGYREVRALQESDLSAVALALPIRHLELMGLTMRYWASHQGNYWITDAYFDQHVDWFRRWEEGRRDDLS